MENIVVCYNFVENYFRKCIENLVVTKNRILSLSLSLSQESRVNI